MQVNKTVELEDGKVLFEGELTQQEADLVVKIGLSVLLQNGALPFLTKTVPGEEAVVDLGDMKFND
jgi:hypothetical protein